MGKIQLILLLILASSPISNTQEINGDDVKKVMKKVADWQMDHININDSYSNKKPHHPLYWTNAALYAGMAKWAEITEDETFYNWLKGIGVQNNWQLHERKYHAGDHAVDRMYTALYLKYGQEEMPQPTIDQFNYIMLQPAKTQLNWGTPHHQDRSNWCNALFMSPPVWADLYQITGDQKCLDFMFEEYKATAEFLFDKAKIYIIAMNFLRINWTTAPKYSGA